MTEDMKPLKITLSVIGGLGLIALFALSIHAITKKPKPHRVHNSTIDDQMSITGHHEHRVTARK